VSRHVVQSHVPPSLTEAQAIDAALSSKWRGRDIRSLPVTAGYGRLADGGTIFDGRDIWQVSVDVSGQGWDMEYEGPGPRIVDGVVYSPQNVSVPTMGTVIITVDDKTGQMLFSTVVPQPGGERRITWEPDGGL
jgi:hypothetical protein